MKWGLLILVGVGAAAVYAYNAVSTIIGEAIDALDLQASEW